MYQNKNVSRAQLLMDNHANDILHNNLQLVSILRTLRVKELVRSIYKPTHLFRPQQYGLVFSNFVTFISPELKFIELSPKNLDIISKFFAQSEGTGIIFSSKMPIICSTIIYNIFFIILRMPYTEKVQFKMGKPSLVPLF